MLAEALAACRVATRVCGRACGHSVLAAAGRQAGARQASAAGPERCSSRRWGPTSEVCKVQQADRHRGRLESGAPARAATATPAPGLCHRMQRRQQLLLVADLPRHLGLAPTRPPADEPDAKRGACCARSAAACSAAACRACCRCVDAVQAEHASPCCCLLPQPKGGQQEAAERGKEARRQAAGGVLVQVRKQQAGVAGGDKGGAPEERGALRAGSGATGAAGLSRPGCALCAA